MTYGESITGQILQQGHSLVQALAHHYGKLRRFTWLGGWRILLEQRVWRSREGKKIPPASVRV